MPITLFPFASGMQQHIDTRLLPDGALVSAENVQLDREGRLVGRGAFAALAMTVQGGTGTSAGPLVAYDLFTLNARLFAFGDAFSRGYATDVFELMPAGVAKQWRPSALGSGLVGVSRLPRATRVRDMARPPDGPDGSGNMDVAAGSGFVALVWNRVTPGTADGYAHIVSAAEGQTVLYQVMPGIGDGPLVNLRVLALDDRFIIIGLTFGTTQMSFARWTFASDESVVTIQTAAIGTGTLSAFNVCRVVGANQFCVAYNLAGTVTVKRFNAAGVLQATYGGIVAAATWISVEASATANQVTLAMVVAGVAKVSSYNYTTTTELGVGPFTVFGASVCADVALVRVSATQVEILSSVTTGSQTDIQSRKYTVATNAFEPIEPAVTDAALTTSPVFSDGETFHGVRNGLGTVGNTPNMLVSHLRGSILGAGSAVDRANVTPQIVKDLEVAGTSSTNMHPSVTRDASTGKYYWANASANPDGDLAPVVTEFEITSTARRQTVQFGNHVYIAGGAPLVFDGLKPVESGFQTRPRIISLTGSNGAGELLNAATYRYRAHWEWIDAEGDLHLGPPSAIVSVTLGASDDTVTAVVTGPHSTRRNIGAPDSSVRCVLSRTLATVDNQPAVASGTAIVTPPSSSLTGLTLKFLAFDGSLTNYTVTFSGAAVTGTVIASEINAITSAKITASHDGEFIQLTSVATGVTVFFALLVAGTANTILGFPASALYRGSTARTIGENFQRAAIEYTVNGAGPVASFVTVTDLRKDQTSPTILDTDLIRQQVLYSQGNASGAHHAPPPGECLWAGRERLVVAKQAKRSRYTVSKLIVPAEPAEFAYEGVLAYSGLVTGDIEAVYVLGDTIVLFTRRQIWAVTGNGPDRSGSGVFIAAQLLSRSLGIASPDGWRSLCEDDAGVWFQGSDRQLYRLNSGGSAEYLGKEVQDLLESYPVVTAAVYVPDKREIAFSVTNDAATEGGVLRYRSESKAWFFDQGSDLGPCAALAEYQGRLVTVQSGVVQIQADVPGTGVPYAVNTGMFQGFAALGYGQLNQVGALGTYRGPAVFEIFSSPDGVDFSVSLGSWSLTDAEYDAGDRVRLLVSPAVQQLDSFALRFRVTPAPGSEGLWLHAAAVDTERQPGFVRLGAAHNL